LLGLVYWLKPSRVQEALDHSVVPGAAAFEPMTILGRVMGLVVSFEYRETSVGVYNELGIGVHVKRRGTKPSVAKTLVSQMVNEPDQALLVLTLPVTTEAARAAGAEIWGYPKYVTDIETEFGETDAQIDLGGELRIDAKRGFGPTMAGLPFVTFSVKEGRLIRTHIQVGHRAGWSRGGGSRLVVTGQGQSAEVARRLGLHDRSPTAVFRTDAMRAILPAGEDLGPLDL
jgi:hypothetical protein